jgi:hypothetical protein
VIFPTRRNLERLALFGSFAEASAQAQAIPVRTITPFIGEKDGTSWLNSGEEFGYPVTGTDGQGCAGIASAADARSFRSFCLGHSRQG